MPSATLAGSLAAATASQLSSTGAGELYACMLQYPEDLSKVKLGALAGDFNAPGTY